MSHRLIARTLAVIVFVVGAAMFTATAVLVTIGDTQVSLTIKWIFFAYCCVCTLGCAYAGTVAAFGPGKPVSQEEADAA